MKVLPIAVTALTTALALSACTPADNATPATPAPPAAAKADPAPAPAPPAAAAQPTADATTTSAPQTAEAKIAAGPPGVPLTAREPFTAGPYRVEPLYEEKLADGHFNLPISGGEIGAVRAWVGGEDPTTALVVKAEVENHYYHTHLEVPNPITPDARLWVEIETPTGEKHKGSTALK
jgi:hypothetical protein